MMTTAAAVLAAVASCGAPMEEPALDETTLLTPSDGAVDVPTNPTILIDLHDEDIVVSLLTSAEYAARTPDPETNLPALDGARTANAVDVGGLRAASFVELEADTEFVATAESASGHRRIWTFRTGAAADETAPTTRAALIDVEEFSGPFAAERSYLIHLEVEVDADTVGLVVLAEDADGARTPAGRELFPQQGAHEMYAEAVEGAAKLVVVARDAAGNTTEAAVDLDLQAASGGCAAVAPSDGGALAGLLALFGLGAVRRRRR